MIDLITSLERLDYIKQKVQVMTDQEQINQLKAQVEQLKEANETWRVQTVKVLGE